MIGIIAVLISILMPALNRTRMQSERVVCQSNMRQCGLALLMYANDNHGVMFPERLGSTKPAAQRWPNYVFTPAVPNPKEMICPSDRELGKEDLDPKFLDLVDGKPELNKHSYILNRHLSYEGILYHRTFGIDASTILVMGEKKSEWYDYYMELSEKEIDPVTKQKPKSDYDRLVETRRHGLAWGSNALFLDGHVDKAPTEKREADFHDSWQVLAVDLATVEKLNN